MPDGYIFEAKDVKGEFLAYFIAHEPDLIKAQNLVRSISMAETVELAGSTQNSSKYARL
jgi:hypothetical protein